mmetsp:Transcript_62625/g.56463  ORF Transcript_62625/g.56463 Transcript_62625/m.56463 type:complete len:94 (+) Transcript_62625:48-329(+)
MNPNRVNPNRVIMRLQYSEPPITVNLCENNLNHSEWREKSPSPDINVIQQQLNALNKDKNHKRANRMKSSKLQYSHPPNATNNGKQRLNDRNK